MSSLQTPYILGEPVALSNIFQYPSSLTLAEVTRIITLTQHCLTDVSIFLLDSRNFLDPDFGATNNSSSFSIPVNVITEY